MAQMSAFNVCMIDRTKVLQASELQSCLKDMFQVIQLIQLLDTKVASSYIISFNLASSAPQGDDKSEDAHHLESFGKKQPSGSIRFDMGCNSDLMWGLYSGNLWECHTRSRFKELALS